MTSTASRLYSMDSNLKAITTEITALQALTTAMSLAELAVLDSVVAGTAAASKAVVLGASKEISTITTATITNLTTTAVTLGATLVTATGTEINKLASVTGGTTAASKALVVDANKRLDTLVIADGGLFLGTTAGTAVTATAVQLNEISVHVGIADVTADASYYVNMPHAGVLTKIYAVVNGAIATADVVITAKIATVAVTNGVVTLATAASAAGTTASATPTAARTVTAGQAVELAVTGGGAGGTPRCDVTIVMSRQ